MTRTAIVILAVILHCIIVCCSPLKTKDMSKNNLTSAEGNAFNYIESFKKGKSYSPPPRGISGDQRIDAGALDILNKHLLIEKGHVRERIVSLMVDASIREDSLYSKGISILREKTVLNSLVKSGLLITDAGRERAADLLRNYCYAHDLSPFADIILEALEVQTSDEMLLLVAKVKPNNANNVINAISTDPYWKNNTSFIIAKAAMGDENAYNHLLDEVYKSIEDNNAEDFAEAILNLGRIGTTEALREVAMQLRTPLIQEMPGVFRKSARLDVLKALIYNFPDIPVFNPNNIRSDFDYVEAERFCIDKFNFDYKDPRPAFLTYFGYGHPK